MARIELTPSGVLFNEELHEYWLDGKQLSGITEAIKKMLHPELYQDIPESILKKAAEYGTFVHQQIYDFDHNFVNSGSQEVKDYIQISKQYNLVHEASEFTVTDGQHWASNIDKIYRVSDDTVSIGDHQDLRSTDTREAGTGKVPAQHLRMDATAAEPKAQNRQAFHYPPSQQDDEEWKSGAYRKHRLSEPCSFLHLRGTAGVLPERHRIHEPLRHPFRHRVRGIAHPRAHRDEGTCGDGTQRHQETNLLDHGNHGREDMDH